ncbi:MAG: hypothetical protein AAF798_15390 [Bacteroidota bacterium]
MFWNRNAIWMGLLLGFALPIIVYAILLTIYDQLEAIEFLTDDTGFSPTFRNRTSMAAALCINLIPLNYYQKRRYVNSMRGLVMATGVFIIAWLYNYGQYIL